MFGSYFLSKLHLIQWVSNLYYIVKLLVQDFYFLQITVCEKTETQSKAVEDLHHQMAELQSQLQALRPTLHTIKTGMNIYNTSLNYMLSGLHYTL